MQPRNPFSGEYSPPPPPPPQPLGIGWPIADLRVYERFVFFFFFFHKTVGVCYVYCNLKLGYACRSTVIFGTLKDLPKSQLLATKWAKNGVFVGGLGSKSPLLGSKGSTFLVSRTPPPPKKIDPGYGPEWRSEDVLGPWTTDSPGPCPSLFFSFSSFSPFPLCLSGPL